MHLSSRERILAAVNHQEPDRVPLALWGSWYGVTDRLYFNILDRLKWEPVPPFRPEKVHSVNYYDDRLLEKLGVDVRHVDPGSTASTSRRSDDGTDGWGLRWDYSGLYRTASHFPLEQATVDEIYAYRLPEPDAVIRSDEIEERLERIRSMDQEYAVVGRAVSSYGFFEMAQSLRRHEQLLTDMLDDPDIVYALIDRLYGCYAGMIERFLDVAGKDLDLLELPGDDYAGNLRPIISPVLFDRFFREPYRKLVELVKGHSPHIKVIFHSDGAITPFLQRLIDIGMDVVHPMEPVPATDLSSVKEKYGQSITFLGGIDIRQALQGSKEEVQAEVRRRIDTLARGGGYILAPANHLQWDVPPENVFTLFETAREYGRYPLEH